MKCRDDDMGDDGVEVSRQASKNKSDRYIASLTLSLVSKSSIAYE